MNKIFCTDYFGKIAFLLLQIICTTTSLAQGTGSETNPSNIARQGFGTQAGFDAGLGFVNPKAETDGSAYYFEDWNTDGVIFTNTMGSFKIKKVNINLFDNKLEALYEENSVFTFDSKNLIKIVINDKVFRIFDIDGELKFFEVFYSDSVSVYKYYSVLYSEASPNPMLNRKTNKYIKKEKFYVYRDGELIKIKLSKKPFSKLMQSDKVSQQNILKYINKSRVSLKDEADLIRVLDFISK